jgi:transmembrane sensor
MATRHDSTSIDDTAAAWVARCDRGPLSADDEAALDAWLAADCRHLGAYARASAVLAHLERARALGAHYDPGRFVTSAARPDNAARRRFLWLAGTAAAASLAGLAFLRPAASRFSTRLGEVLRLPLRDGSVVTLNSATELVVEFSRARRLVRLMHGEALFDVASDALRPFVVEAAQASVVAVGTSFTVQRVADAAIEVVVREGSVDFDVDAGLVHVPPVRLAANTMALARPDRRVEVEPLKPIDVRRRLAWRDGMISFDGDTLAHAASQFARYSDTRIVIDDPAVAQLHVVGLYSANNPVGFAQAVALSMNLHVERRGDMVRLARR